MTATTPTPDSGAAASRDAARTARRLTTEPRAPRPVDVRPPESDSGWPDGASVSQEPGSATVLKDRAADLAAAGLAAGDPAPMDVVATDPAARGLAAAGLVATGPAAGDLAATGPAAGNVVATGPAARDVAATGLAATDLAATGPAPTEVAATDPAASAPTAPGVVGGIVPPVSRTPGAPEPTAPGHPAAGAASTIPAPPVGSADRPTAPEGSAAVALGPRAPQGAEWRAGAPVGATASGAHPVVSAAPSGAVGEAGARSAVGATATGGLAVGAPGAPASEGSEPPAGVVAGGPVSGARTSDAVGTPVSTVHPDRPTGPSGSSRASATPAGTTAAEPRPPEAAGAAAPLPAPPAAPGRAPDLRRIVRGDVGVVAVPVVAEAHVAVRPVVRRKNVIGAETTGSIPVHLLFRDEPDTDSRKDVGVDVDDDGGPATVAMAPPRATAPKAVIPAPTRPKAAARPAPTADPKLVERPAPALPGWIGVVAGVLALAGCAAVVWSVGAVPEELARMLRLPPRPYQGIHLGQWALLTLGVLATLFAFGGLGRGRVGYAWVLTLFGDYRGSVRRTGLVWTSPLLLRRRVDVRLRHWRSEPLSSVDAKGTALNVVVLVVWRIRDTVRAALGVDGHEEYLREQVEAAMARVLSQLPADAFHEDAPTLRDAEAVGEALTRMLSAECAPVGIDVFSAQPTRIEYAPEIAAAMQRRRIAAIDAKHRDSVLTSVVDAVDDVVHRLTTRGLVELDDYERKALVKDLTVAFYTGRTGPVEGA
ncbi:SPFH domain-containing protein [Streptomyces sp. P9(2023)]|uniref:SPFH domain-containing protein n=1 Tax=Streptomyces sp. P9(2023) TaxID=3064394 RepID=UPI0028F40F8F|nr:SPFH domain-containing protein [Streptomyces sp. P9(2023)]MDT9689221.1 SPFH domain-containing protein [Streptomyces sp. P9(2023)]